MGLRRQLINRPEDVVVEALEGFAIAQGDAVQVDREHRLVVRGTPSAGKVGLVSGGGSGHEPLHVGFVGYGMLDVAVAGGVFASPTTAQVHQGTVRADHGAGVLHIVKNYTGDIINFGIAADLAADDGIDVATVVVNEDLATDASGDGPGRRGTAAVVAVEKMCGAAAEAGLSLSRLKVLGDRIVERSRTLSLALAAGARPGHGEPAFTLDPERVEFGVGIHGERGRSQIAFATAQELVDQLVHPLIDDLPSARDSSLLVIVNGLGATTSLELHVVARHVASVLTAAGASPTHWLVGDYVTSLDMSGVSVTLVELDDELEELWRAPMRTPALNW